MFGHRYLTSRNGIGNGSRAPVGISTFGVGIFGAKVGANGEDRSARRTFLVSFGRLSTEVTTEGSTFTLCTKLAKPRGILSFVPAFFTA